MIREALTFDDVLLVPQYSEYSPSKVATEVQLTKRLTLRIPLLSAAMDTVTESPMAIALAQAGGLGIIHKNLDIVNQINEVRRVKRKNLPCGAAVSVGADAIQRAKALVATGANVIVVDVAHGHYYKVAETLRRLKKFVGKRAILVGGNVATAKATADLIKAGADVVKVGVGPGSICTTRIIAGIGVPQLTAIMEAAKAARRRKTPIIADGGIRYSGDLVKALAAGATAVMVGSLFAGTDEAPGKVITLKGKKYKVYRGMGSIEAMERGSGDRYLQADRKTADEMIAEGVVSYLPYKGPVGDVVYQLVGGLKQGLGYCGAPDIKSLYKRAEFVKISVAGLKESHPHSLEKIKRAPNYQSDFL